MKRNPILITLSLYLNLLLSSCTEAPSSGRANNQTQNRKPTEIACTDGNTTIQCATTYSGLMVSHTYHNIGAKQLSYLEEADFIKAQNLPATHRTIPNPQIDNDKTVKHITTGINGEYAKNECGVGEDYPSILARRNSCFSAHENGAGTDEENGKSNWYGDQLGNSGEGQWKLVLRDIDKDITIWFDTRTNLIWSSVLPNEEWAVASGVSKDLDPSCQSLNELTKTIAYPNGQIVWRMPNRNEFLQADLNGARFVLDGVNNKFWTASTADTETHAWAIKQSTGELFKDLKTYENSVRCIGVEI